MLTLSLTVTALLAAAPATATPPLRLALPGLGGLSEKAEVLGFYSEHLAQQLKVAGLDVVTYKEISSLLGMERQKQLLGCEADSCMAELASALGADCVVLGDVAKVGDGTQINLKIISSKNGKTLATFSERAVGQEAVVDALTSAAAKLTVEVSRSLDRPVPEGVKNLTVHSPLRRWSLVAIISGGVLAAAGGGLLYKTNADFARLTAATPATPLSADDSLAMKTVNPTLQTAGVGLAAVGGAALVSGVLMMLSGNSSVAVALVPSSGGATLALGGAFP